MSYRRDTSLLLRIHTARIINLHARSIKKQKNSRSVDIGETLSEYKLRPSTLRNSPGSFLIGPQLFPVWDMWFARCAERSEFGCRYHYRRLGHRTALRDLMDLK